MKCSVFTGLLLPALDFFMVFCYTLQREGIRRKLNGGDRMLIKIGNFEFTEVWDGVLYKKLSNYPQITDWEIRTIIECIAYEKSCGRECAIECEDAHALQAINEGILHQERFLSTPRPKLLTECTACPYRKGCVTEYVCHTTSADNAIKIFECGKLLSAVKARKVPVEELIREKRNAANDPADYFEYIMLSWGNCQAGDRLAISPMKRI